MLPLGSQPLKFCESRALRGCAGQELCRQLSGSARWPRLTEIFTSTCYCTWPGPRCWLFAWQSLTALVMWYAWLAVNGAGLLYLVRCMEAVRRRAQLCSEPTRGRQPDRHPQRRRGMLPLLTIKQSILLSTHPLTLSHPFSPSYPLARSPSYPLALLPSHPLA